MPATPPSRLKRRTYSFREVAAFYGLTERHTLARARRGYIPGAHWLATGTKTVLQFDAQAIDAHLTALREAPDMTTAPAPPTVFPIILRDDEVANPPSPAQQTARRAWALTAPLDIPAGMGEDEARAALVERAWFADAEGRSNVQVEGIIFRWEIPGMPIDAPADFTPIPDPTTPDPVE